MPTLGLRARGESTAASGCACRSAAPAMGRHRRSPLSLAPARDAVPHDRWPTSRGLLARELHVWPEFLQALAGGDPSPRAGAARRRALGRGPGRVARDAHSLPGAALRRGRDVPARISLTNLTHHDVTEERIGRVG